MHNYIQPMKKPGHRDRMLTEGLRVVHQHGFASSSVRDIVQAAGVPQGSFTNHFRSKEAFGLEIIELHLTASRELIAQTLGNDRLPPLQRLRSYINNGKERLNQDDIRKGCLFGNFTAEASEHSELMRQRLVGIFAEVQQALAYCLRAAVEAGELLPGLDCEEMAGFIVASLQGANLLAKAQRSPLPVERFEDILFSAVLRRSDG
jgi:TetR/AcrR family transcriptional repressor of nem operon